MLYVLETVIFVVLEVIDNRPSLLFQYEDVLVPPRVHHVALPCFYSTPEQTNQTPALETAYQVFTLPEGHRGLQHAWKERGEQIGCNQQTHH